MYTTITGLPLDPPESDRADGHPVTLFSTWFEEAKTSGMKEPSAVFLATATRCGAPSCRVVLLKDASEDGFVIYTNMNSRKGREIQENPQAALCFYWQPLGKQVRIEGHVSAVSEAEADAYFASRPAKSRIGAWASKQSELLTSHADLLKRVAFYGAQWALGNIPRPPYWRGIRVVPDIVEFCDDSVGELPERRVFYLRDGNWYEARLQP